MKTKTEFVLTEESMDFDSVPCGYSWVPITTSYTSELKAKKAFRAAKRDETSRKVKLFLVSTTQLA